MAEVSPPVVSTPDSSVAMTVTQLARQLRELVAALDRRVPRVGRATEASIAGESAALRAEAVKRLAELATKDTPGAGGPADRPLRGGR